VIRKAAVMIMDEAKRIVIIPFDAYPERGRLV
jgi:hypothetical protein